eukprot:52233-Amphidinium_carterae.1
MMRPNRTFIKWKGRIFAGYRIVTGLTQGSPWSGLAFALAIDPFVRFAMDQIPWSIPTARWVLFADDMVAGARNPHELDVLSVVFVVLEDATGMAIGIKSKIMPIGLESVEDFRTELARVIVPGHSFEVFPVVTETRWLGVWISRGPLFNPHACMIQRMLGKLELLARSGLGAAGNIFLARAALFSVASHTLGMCEPSAELRQCWSK